MGIEILVEMLGQKGWEPCKPPMRAEEFKQKALKEGEYYSGPEQTFWAVGGFILYSSFADQKERFYYLGWELNESSLKSMGYAKQGGSKWGKKPFIIDLEGPFRLIHTPSKQVYVSENLPSPRVIFKLEQLFLQWDGQQ